MSLDQWTPATVAAAQANRPRRYGYAHSGVAHQQAGLPPIDAEVLGRVYRRNLDDSVDSVAPPGHPGRPDYLSWVANVIDRGEWGNYSDYTGNQLRQDWAPYAALRAGWSRAQHVANFGRVVQTFRQAVARIVRRAKWRRIIRGLRLRARVGTIPTFFWNTIGTHHWEGARMWPTVPHPSTATPQQQASFAERFLSGRGRNNTNGIRGTPHTYQETG